jgi:hypothetical protein
VSPSSVWTWTNRMLGNSSRRSVSTRTTFIVQILDLAPVSSTSQEVFCPIIHQQMEK